MTEHNNIIAKINGKLKSMFAKVHNMHVHHAEQYYFKQYFTYIEPFLKMNMRVLDVGCQYGRFTIPMAKMNLDVTATDLKKKYFTYISKKIPDHSKVTFRQEEISATINALKGEKFDMVLCTELLYNLPDPLALLKGLKTLLSPEGILIASHRSLGYYIHLFLKKKKYDELKKMLGNQHPGYNACLLDDLLLMYDSVGLKVIETYGIGLFSGYGQDPFSGSSDPGCLSMNQKEHLFKFETDKSLQSAFINNARYIMVIAGQS